MPRNITTKDAERMMKKMGGGRNDTKPISNEKIDEICTPVGDGDGIPIASKSNLGCVIVGDNLNVRKDGTVYADEYVPEAITNLELESILVLEEEA